MLFLLIKIMQNQLTENFFKSLVVIASGISKGMDPYILINGVAEYLMKNWDRYKDHPNLKAIAVLKMKGLYIDEIRKNKNFQNLPTDDEGNILDIPDDDEPAIIDKLEIKSEFKKTLLVIKSMGVKCREILMLAAEGLTMQDMLEITKVKSLGTVLSRLSNCRKELKERLSND
jgi:DNA-directed RNA polymerase specialized sigma24 family protein